MSVFWATMGSQPSVIEVPEGHKIKVVNRSQGRQANSASSAPSTSRQKGFKEVEITDPTGSSTPRNKRKKTNQEGGWDKVQSRVNEVTDGKDTDFHSVVNKAHTKAKEGNDFDQPQYSVSCLKFLFYFVLFYFMLFIIENLR